MTTAYTSLLGLALPVTGELSGTWGDTVNNSITSLLDSAIAGTTTITADTTLSTTTGAANQSRQAILLCSPASANITITAPAQSKIYTVINTSATYTVTVRGVGPTTGVTLGVSEKALVAWDGSDFIRVSNNGGAGVFTSITDSGNLTFTGTGNRITGDFSNATIASRLIFQSSTTNGATGIYVIPNGISDQSQIVLANASDATNASIAVFGVPSGSTDVRINSGKIGTGTYLPITFYTGGSERVIIDTTGNVGIGTSSPAVKTNIVGSAGVTLRIEETSSGNANKGDFSANSANVAIGAKSNSPLVFITNDTERMRIDTSGNVGIGTSSPAKKLHVNGDIRLGDGGGTGAFFTDATNGLRFMLPASGTSNTEAMRIDSSGNVGIGTTSPATILNAYNATSAIVSVDGDTASQLRVSRYSTDVSGAFVLIRKARGTFASPSAVASGDVAGYFQASAYGGTNYRAVGLITSVVDTYTSDTNISGYLTFGTNSGSTATTERMRIDSSGNVGIGTSSPSAKLDVLTSINLGFNYLNIGYDLGGGAGWLGGYNVTYSSGVKNVVTGALSATAYQTGNIVFYTNASAAAGTTATERMRIDSAGNAYIETGNLWQYAPAPTSKSTTATLTAAELLTGILNTTGTSYTVTVPTGTAIDAGWTGVPATNIGFEFVVINTASGTITMAVNTNVTSLGTLTIATGVSARFRFRRTAANTYVMYRIG